MCWSASISYPGETRSPALGRAFCAEHLRGGLPDDVSVDAVIADAELIVSELITNALNAQSGRTDLVLSVRDHEVRIEVRDDAAGAPVVRTPDVTEGHGRGLRIVAALADRWGVEPDGPGKRVWAELRVA